MKLQIKNLSYDYKTQNIITPALKNINLEFESGKMYAITGRSGSGKTTLLSLIAAFDTPKSGEILYDDVSITELIPTEYRKNKIGIVFQSYNLIGHLSALDNVVLALDIVEKKQDKHYAAKKILHDVGLDESTVKKRPSNLSGGEQQRVAVARAFATRPDIILADEPTGNLDSENSRNIVSLLKKYAHEDNKCVIVVTHSEEVAASADVRYNISDGTVT